MNRRLILPVGLVIALLVGLVVPQPGLWLADSKLTYWVIAIIFLINGFQTHPRSLKPSPALAGAVAIAGVVGYGGGSLLAALMAWALPFNPEIATGIIVIGTMAPTLSSAIVITRESGGNATWATLLTVILNLASVVIVPLLLSVLLASHHVDLPVMPMLTSLSLSVLLPFVIGMLVHWRTHWKCPELIGLLPTLLIILLAYMAFASGRATLLGHDPGEIVLLAAALFALHVLLLLAAVGLGRLFGYAAPERTCLAFIGSQKTLPASIAILTTLGVAGGAAALPCVMLHFIQILTDAIIAAKWRKSANL